LINVVFSEKHTPGIAIQLAHIAPHIAPQPAISNITPAIPANLPGPYVLQGVQQAIKHSGPSTNPY
jgi:hypothetical protein